MCIATIRGLGSKVVLGLTLSALLACLSGCTSDTEDPGSKKSDAPRPKVKTVESVAQDLLPGLDQVRVQDGGNLPRRISVPTVRPPDLLEALPGRALLAYVRLDQSFDAKGFGDQDVYFYGVDGGWRVLNMGDLGLPASEWTGPDGSGLVRLSPRGDAFTFVTPRRIALFNLSSGRLRFLSLPRRGTPILPSWTTRGTLLSASMEERRISYEIEPVRGRARTIKMPYWRVSVMANGDLAVSGVADRRPYLRYVDAANRTISRKFFPFTWDSPLSGQHAADRIAVFMDSLATLAPTDEESSLVVVNADTLEPVASLPWKRRSAADQQFGWLDKRTYLLRHGRSVAIWCPDHNRLTRVASMPADLAMSVALDAVDAECN